MIVELRGPPSFPLALIEQVVLGAPALAADDDPWVGRTRDEVVVGDAVGYELTVTNTTSAPLTSVTLEDRIPPGFKYVKDSAVLIRAGSDSRLDTDDDLLEITDFAQLPDDAGQSRLLQF